MKICRKCKGTSIRSRKNYTHGKKSKPATTYSCKKCGSTDIEVKSENYGKRRFRKRY